MATHTHTKQPNTDQLLHLLHERFGYTADNNRDLVGDPTFTLAEVTEEILVQAAYEYLVAYLARATPQENEAYFG